MTESKTPMVDKHLESQHVAEQPLVETVEADFARKLERELASAQAELAEARAELEARRRCEFICPKCGIRQQGERVDADF